ncbi:hypothetical protein, partial [Herbiconiux daphne]
EFRNYKKELEEVTDYRQLFAQLLKSDDKHLTGKLMIRISICLRGCDKFLDMPSRKRRGVTGHNEYLKLIQSITQLLNAMKAHLKKEGVIPPRPAQPVQQMVTRPVKITLRVDPDWKQSTKPSPRNQEERFEFVKWCKANVELLGDIPIEDRYEFYLENK